MVKKRESSILGVLFHKRTIPFVLIPLLFMLKNSTGKQLHDLCVYWMNLVKVLLQKVSLCKR
jgi:hypothetical protein